MLHSELNRRWTEGNAMMMRLALGVLFALASAAANAQDSVAFPRQIRIVIPSVPGAGPDFIARLIAPKLAEALKSTVLVENRAATNGVAAAVYTAKAAADGSVLMMGNSGTHAVNAALYRKLEYDTLLLLHPH